MFTTLYARSIGKPLQTCGYVDHVTKKKVRYERIEHWPDGCSAFT